MEQILPVATKETDVQQFENHIPSDDAQDSYPFEFSRTTLWNTPANNTDSNPLLNEIVQIRRTLEDIKGLLCEVAQPFEDVDK